MCRGQAARPWLAYRKRDPERKREEREKNREMCSKKPHGPIELGGDKTMGTAP